MMKPPRELLAPFLDELIDSERPMTIAEYLLWHEIKGEPPLLEFSLTRRRRKAMRTLRIELARLAGLPERPRDRNGRVLV